MTTFLRSLVASSLLLFCFSLSAQLQNFDLGTYKLPDIKRQQLDFNLSTNFNHYNRMPVQTLYLNGNGNLSATYISYTNLQNYQGDLSVNLGLAPNIYRWKTDSYDNKNNELNMNVGISSSNRFYLHNLFFAEADINASLGLLGRRELRDYFNMDGDLTRQDDYRTRRFNPALEVPLLVGYGRIERVEDARLAIYILEDLEKLGRLKRTPSQEEVLELARLISVKKNERVLDSRIKKIEELKAIDAFLLANGLVTEADAVYFTSVNDNWDYSAGPMRTAGYRIYGGLVPGFLPQTEITSSLSLDSNDDTLSFAETDNQNQSLSLSLRGGVEYGKPINLKWQLTAGAIIDYNRDRNILTDRINDSESRSRLSGLFPSQFIGLGYYPNSRTYSRWSLSLEEQSASNFLWNEASEEWDKSGKSTFVSLNFGWQLYYYVSPQFRISGSYYLNMNKNKNKPEVGAGTHNSYFSNSLAIGLLYSLF